MNKPKAMADRTPRGAIINFKSSKQEHPLDDKTKYFAVFIEKDGEIAHVSLIMGWILCNWIKRDYYGEILFVLADKFKNAVTEGISAADVEPVVRCKDCRYFDVTQTYLCDMHHRAANEDDYCSYGIRKMDSEKEGV